MKSITTVLIFIFFPLFMFSQNTESIAKMFCNCDVLTSSKLLNGNKIIFIANETESFFGVNLTYNEIQKVNGQWSKKRKSKISFISNDIEENNITNLEDFSFAQQDENAKTISVIKINDIDFYYSIINLGMNGTAYNGMNAFLFIFQDIEHKYMPVKLYYERWDGEFTGNYKVENKSIDNYFAFIEESNKFISQKFGVANDDIDSPENFHLKWMNSNSHVYKNLEDDNSAYFEPIEYEGKTFYNIIKSEYEVEEISNEYYKVITGFKTPVIAYEKKSNKSIILYIPQGWPNGASWGSRSFWPKKINGKSIFIESEDEILEIRINDDIGNGQILQIKKSD